MNAPALVKAARKAAGLTQIELARRAGLTQPEVARLEAPGANPRFETLHVVLEAAGAQLELSTGGQQQIDPTLIADGLASTPSQRLQTVKEMYDWARKNVGKAQRQSA